VARAGADVATLELHDPDTDAAVASDLPAMLASVPAAAGRGSTMPAWSNDGDFVVFSAYHADHFPGAKAGLQVQRASLIEASVRFDGTTYHFGPPRVLVPVADTEVNIRPAISEDDETIAFTRTTIVAGGKHETLWLLRRSDGKLLPASSTDPTDVWRTRFPAWSPTISGKYQWLVVTSSRPYGHRAGSTAQLWVLAVDRAELAAGRLSASPFYAPGQIFGRQYCRPLWPRSIPLGP
jgi:hypothetical protein